MGSRNVISLSALTANSIKPNQIEVFDGFIKMTAAHSAMYSEDAYVTRLKEVPLFFLGNENKPVSLTAIQNAAYYYCEDIAEAVGLVYEQGGRWLAAVHAAQNPDDDPVYIAPQDIFRLISKTPDAYCRDLLQGPEKYSELDLDDEYQLFAALTSSRYLPAIRLVVERSCQDRFKIPESVSEQIAPLIVVQAEDWRKQYPQVARQLFSWECVKMELRGEIDPKTTDFSKEVRLLDAFLESAQNRSQSERLVSRMLHELKIVSDHNYELFRNLLEKSADEDEDWDQAPPSALRL